MALVGQPCLECASGDLVSKPTLAPVGFHDGLHAGNTRRGIHALLIHFHSKDDCIIKSDGLILEHLSGHDFGKPDTAGAIPARQHLDLIDQSRVVGFGMHRIICKALQRLIDGHKGGDHLFQRSISTVFNRLAHNLKTDRRIFNRMEYILPGTFAAEVAFTQTKLGITGCVPCGRSPTKYKQSWVAVFQIMARSFSIQLAGRCIE